MKKIFYTLITLVFLFILASCETGTTPTNSLSYANSTKEMYVGETIDAKPVVKGGVLTLIYELSNNIASIDEEGNLTALEKGTVTLTVRAVEDTSVKAVLLVLIKENEQPVQYTITLDVNGGDEILNNAITLEAGLALELPVPTKEGYNFLGWYNGEVKFEENVMPEENITLVAQWEKQEVIVPPSLIEYTITLDVNGGEEILNNTIILEVGSSLELPEPTRDGYNFLGWYKGETKFEDTVMPAENITLVAKWEKIIITYTINYDVNGGVMPINAPTSFIEGEKISLPVPTRDGYKFLGWYEDELIVDVVSNKDYNLVANWEEIGSKIQITYILEDDVILSNYTSRAELISDLISDIQTIKGSTYTLDWFNSTTGSGYGLFASAEGVKTFFADAAMRAKWNWILEYAKSLREASGLNTTHYDSLMINGYVEAEAATINVEMIGFITGKEYSYVVSETTTYKSSDYSNSSNANGFWEKIHNNFLANVTFDKDVNALSVLPNAIKNGAVFGGWYTSSDFNASSKINETTVFTQNTTVYAKFIVSSGDASTVTFDYNGGVSNELYSKYGTKLTSLVINRYNSTYSDFWSSNSEINYSSNVFVSTSANDPKAKFSTRLYIAKDMYTGIYTVVAIIQSGVSSTWAPGAEYVITLSGSYEGTYDDNFNISKVSIGTIVVFDKTITSISANNPSTVSFYNDTLANSVITEKVDSTFVMPTPKKVGYTFIGWYDNFNNKYEIANDFIGLGTITVTAMWKFEDRIIGSFESNSWVVSGETIKLNAYYYGGTNGTMKWVSENPNIATVDQNGLVTGYAEGVATIIVCDSEYEDIKFVFYITVFEQEPEGMLKVIVDSNNESIFTRDNLLIGITYGSDGAYYSDIVGSVSKLLFVDYKEYTTYYLSSPSKTSSLTGSGKGGVDFITVHYAADMPYSASAMYNGGKNLASYNQTASGASWHYSVGNDGIWYCQNTAYGAWHAGRNTTMTWTDSGVTTAQVGTDVYPTDVTLKNGYFYIKGVKTTVANTTSGTKLNGMGLGVKLVGDKWYLGGHQYKSDYGYIGSTGGNGNSIGMETSVREGSDLWLTWQYTAQLCAKLLLQFELPLNRLVGHHFFSGKWCPQPMLENDLEIWYEFVELTRQQMDLYQNYSNYTLSFDSSSEYLKDNGRVSKLPNYPECVTYTVSYTVGSTTKTITLSSILPGVLE